MKKFLRSSFFYFALAFCFALTPTIVMPCIGLLLLIIKIADDRTCREINGTLNEKEKALEQQEAELLKQKELVKTETEKYVAESRDIAKAIIEECEGKAAKLDGEISAKEAEIGRLKKEIQSLQSELDMAHMDTIIGSYELSDYDSISSEECKDKLSILKAAEKELVKSNNAFFVNSHEAKKVINNNIKQVVRCFNAECDNVLLNLNAKNIDSSRNKVARAYDSLNTIFGTDGIQINKELLELKLQQLNLAYTYEVKKEQEREEQKAIREQMLEEEKVRREIEREKTKIEKEESQFKNEVSKLMSYLQKTSNDAEKTLYLDKIKELEDKLKMLEKDKENVLEREQNTRAGFVYVISNIGSFGDNIYKIGMTRRLEPMDRISELSNASVPFPFDVHAIIFSEDAPTLETTLHHTFKNCEVNKINSRKEFFAVNLDEIERVVKENHNATVTFTKIAEASQYRRSTALISDGE